MNLCSELSNAMPFPTLNQNQGIFIAYKPSKFYLPFPPDWLPYYSPHNFLPLLSFLKQGRQILTFIPILVFACKHLESAFSLNSNCTFLLRLPLTLCSKYTHTPIPCTPYSIITLFLSITLKAFYYVIKLTKKVDFLFCP